MKESASITFGIFLITLGARFIPLADAIAATAKVPLSMVPPAAPWLVAAVGCWLVLHTAFRVTLGEAH